MHVPFIFSKAGVVETTPTTPVSTPLRVERILICQDPDKKQSWNGQNVTGYRLRTDGRTYGQRDVEVEILF